MIFLYAAWRPFLSKIANSRLPVAVAAVTVITVCCPIRADADDVPSLASMVESLKSSGVEVIRRSIEDAIEAREDSRQKRFILELWTGNEERYPDLSWAIINTPQVRVTIARALVPMAQRGRDAITKDDLADYAWSVTGSPDAKVVRDAFEVIGNLDRKADVDRISRYLADEKRETFGGYYGAVWALAAMCSDGSRELLDAIESRESENKRREIISDARAYWDPVKERFDYCRYRNHSRQ